MKKMKEYGGRKECCDYCGQPFKYGDRVLVSMRHQLIFCYALAGGCATTYKGDALPEHEIIQLEEMRFHGNT